MQEAPATEVSAAKAREHLIAFVVHPRLAQGRVPQHEADDAREVVATLGDEWDDVLEHEVLVPEHIRVKALQAVERMPA